jgi:predicted nuclease of predicted toxin-antitoxin system
MRFLVDNSLSPKLAAALLNAGHDAVHIRALAVPDSSDEFILDLAASQARAVVAADVDFGTILAMRGSTHPSAVIFRCTLRSTDYVLHVFLANLPAIEADLLAGAVVVFDDHRIRVRRLPIV